MTTETPLLEASDIDFAYGDVTILEDVSVAAHSAAVTALVGPNGTGKTTLLRTLAGLQEPTDGTVTYHGPSSERTVGYLPQHPQFRPGFTVSETLEFYASLVGGDQEAALHQLERVGLADAAERPVEALSGGMTRLVGIAQATIGDPPLIVLDEPASGLDPGMSKHVFDVANELAEAGTGVLLSSHDLELVDRTADQVFVLDEGSVVTRGHPNTLCNQLGVDSLQNVYEELIAGDLRSVRVQGETA
ncbi:ABC transporter ATP-binding protein [Natronolimnobius sp. AArcel1]|uniref:ABC transporter ATP-binding protein n=1 Tax=Natronolimnobius sp. AArcel1 TaxID=1679093 RepID=UPI0013EAD3E0|nr:ABC transporter ATP-binding protein [Natronolimnobius sp. AArcel1]NGM70424.1 ABC transporter ATP-binding protein [Natronolimnobius sp. AArcel1]